MSFSRCNVHRSHNTINSDQHESMDLMCGTHFATVRHEDPLCCLEVRLECTTGIRKRLLAVEAEPPEHPQQKLISGTPIMDWYTGITATGKWSNTGNALHGTHVVSTTQRLQNQTFKHMWSVGTVLPTSALIRGRQRMCVHGCAASSKGWRFRGIKALGIVP